MKKCVVSFADKTGSYQKKLQRLEQSLKGNFDGDFLGFTSYQDINCEPHSEIPYKFKPMAIESARIMGYDLVLWADSPVYAKQSIEPVFQYLMEWKYLFFDNIGFSLGDYTNDKTLAYFHITRAESWRIKMIMACVMGFNFSNNDVCGFFKRYKDVADSLYPGEWNNIGATESKDLRCRGHRHDQSVMSAIIHHQGLKVTKGQDTFFAYETHRQVMSIADSVCLYSG